MNRICLLLLVSLLFFTQYSCRNEKKSDADNKDTDKKTDHPRDYSVFKLPKELDEISGISFIDTNNLVGIEDEGGFLYYYNLSTNQITDKKKFGEDGDYEDVAAAGNDAYVVNSNGELYEIKDFKNPGKLRVNKIKTLFDGKNNIEGLAYDPDKNCLLISPKDKGLDSDKDKEIYAFDLATKKLNTTPVYSISLSQIEDYFKGDALEESSKDFLKAIGNKNLNEVFRPSGLAIHPSSNEIYVLSSLNNLIAILSTDGALKRIIKLKGKEFLQPEGIAFSPDGKLYISNEGKGGKANIIHLIL